MDTSVVLGKTTPENIKEALRLCDMLIRQNHIGCFTYFGSIETGISSHILYYSENKTIYCIYYTISPVYGMKIVEYTMIKNIEAFYKYYSSLTHK